MSNIGNKETMAKNLSYYLAKAGKSQKEISSLLDKYLAATAKQRELENGVGDRYKAALPVEKVARLYIGEEKFRRHHIRNMHHGNGPQGQGGKK